MSDQCVSPSSSTDANTDNWFGVRDPKKRKQIQDRLAQGARRMIFFHYLWSLLCVAKLTMS
jgi:hypothetical protein